MPLAETNWVEQENSLNSWRIYQRMTSFLYIFEASYDFYPMGIMFCASFSNKTSAELSPLPFKSYSDFS